MVCRSTLPLRWLLILAVILGAHRANAAEPSANSHPANRLAHESSPYLREHAHNPVDWYPWGLEAFARAQKENKLVFLSVGYSACHWCHVMAKETFSNEEVAKLLNDSFVCIKVDREERPDVDQIYQLAVQLFVKGEPTGWPLSVFLTPEGKPIAGSGIFLPPEDRLIDGQRLPGLKSLIRAVLDARRDNGKEIFQQADQVARTVALALGRSGRANGPGPRRYLVTAAVDAFKEEFDPDFGGFGNPRVAFRESKFPMAPALALILQEAQRQNSDQLLAMVTTTLDRMAAGGIYDQVGGGFHRYSTERTWTVPHFEKMLSDNAQLVELYARCYERTQNAVYRRVVDETLAFVGRELTAANGGFYTALDADSDGEEGRYYVWTAAEFQSALPDPAERALARMVYGVGDTPILQQKYFVLTRQAPGKEPTDRQLAEARQKLFAARSRRRRPLLDEKIVTACNGQMVAAYAVAGRVCAEPRYTEAAVRAADFVLNNLRTIDGRLLRTFAAVPGEKPKASLVGYLEDYAFFTDGLLDLYDTTHDARWLAEARALTDLMVRYYGDEAGGFYQTASDSEKMFARGRDAHDGAQPSGSSVAVRNLIRLAIKTGESRYRDVADRALRSFTVELEQNPTALPTMAAAVDQFLDGGAPQPPAAEPPAGVKPIGSDSVVTATAAAKPASSGKQTVTITLNVAKNWHIYANPVGNADQESSRTSVAITARGKPKTARIDYPKGKLIKDPLVGDYKVYEGRVEIKAVVERAAGDTGPLDIAIKVQACDEKTCLRPATIKLTVP